jgi:hypothetical protein
MKRWATALGPSAVVWANGPGSIITHNPDGTIAGLHCYGMPPS